MADLEAILRTIDDLSPEEKQRIVEYIQRNNAEPATQPRVIGLHAGAIQMSDDFDEPLPDDFWLSGE